MQVKNDNPELRKVRRIGALAMVGLSFMLLAAVLSFFDRGKPLQMCSLFVFFVAVLSPFIARWVRVEREARHVNGVLRRD